MDGYFPSKKYFPGMTWVGEMAEHPQLGGGLVDEGTCESINNLAVRAGGG